MPGAKRTTNETDMARSRDTLGGVAATTGTGVGDAESPVPTGSDPGTDRASTDSHAGRHDVLDHDPAAEPAGAKRPRSGKFPAWILLPRDVAISLAAIVVAGVVILLVLSGQ
jgi:hypothetical protein